MKCEGIRGSGPWVCGLADADRIPRKRIAAKSGVHESTISRFFNGEQDVNVQQFGFILLAIGEARAEGEHQKRGAR